MRVLFVSAFGRVRGRPRASVYIKANLTPLQKMGLMLQIFILKKEALLLDYISSYFKLKGF
jgi:hypothetical protein